MGRIFYLLLGSGGLTGGLKMTIRHVEALCELGFEAACYLPPGHKPPGGLEIDAPILPAAKLDGGDIIVIPDDAGEAIDLNRRLGDRCVIFSQGTNTFATVAAERLASYSAERRPSVMAVAPDLARLIRRLCPGAEVAMVPCFADERRFAPRQKHGVIACTPRKRPVELSVIRGMFSRLYPGHCDLNWAIATHASEAEMSAILGHAAVHLALPRMESVGLTTLEAMAAGCICAGFLGVGGRQYGTPDNGFWVPDDDCEAAADALARACDLVKTGGRPLSDMRAAAQETARRWSRVSFLAALERTWSAWAPEARRLPIAAIP